MHVADQILVETFEAQIGGEALAYNAGGFRASADQ
jgi:hypothetical protein